MVVTVVLVNWRRPGLTNNKGGRKGEVTGAMSPFDEQKGGQHIFWPPLSFATLWPFFLRNQLNVQINNERYLFAATAKPKFG